MLKEKYLDDNEEFWDYNTADIQGTSVVDKTKTGISFYNDFLTSSGLEYLRVQKNLTGKIVNMSPEEYYEECSKNIFNISVDNLKRQRRFDKRILDNLTKVLTYYKKKLCLPMINYADKGQEGLHRMMVIGDLYGWDFKVPVLVVDWYDKERAEQEKNKKYIDEMILHLQDALRNSVRYNYTNFEEFKEQLQWDLDKEFEDEDTISKPVKFDVEELSNEYIFYLKDLQACRYELEKDWIKYKEDTIDETLNLKTNNLSESIDKQSIDKLIQEEFGSTNPGEGCIFISPNGKFINIYPQLDDHEDLCYWLEDELEDQGIDENEIVEDAEWITDTFDYIRCRNSLHLCFAALPENGLTQDQYRSLELWMEEKVSTQTIQIYIGSKSHEYDTDEYFPEDIIKLIKRFYSSGILYESVDPNQKDCIIKILEEHNHCYYQSSSLCCESICESLCYDYNLDAKYKGRTIYINDSKIATIKFVKDGNNLIAMTGYTLFI